MVLRDGSHPASGLVAQTYQGRAAAEKGRPSKCRPQCWCCREMVNTGVAGHIGTCDVPAKGLAFRDGTPSVP